MKVPPYRTLRAEADFRRLYDNSPTLRNLPEDSFQSPEVLVSRLVEKHRTIEAELISRDGLDCRYRLTSLVRSLFLAGRIGDFEPFRRVAAARSLYERSQILQDIRESEIESTKDLLKVLLRLRSEVEQERQHSLSTLAHALIVGGKLRGDDQSIIRMVGARDLYDGSPLLQGINDDDLASSKRLMMTLSRLRHRITKEQQAKSPYSLSTLAHALVAGGRIPSDVDYHREASARDLYERSPLLQRISDRDLSKPERLVKKLLKLRPRIIKEQRREGYSLGFLVMALDLGDRLKGDPQKYERLAGARDLFDRSKVLQAIRDRDLATPKKAVAKLARIRGRIEKEQGKLRESSDGQPIRYSLNTLIDALIAGERIQNKTQVYQRMAGARELYDRSTCLQEIQQDVLSSPELLIDELVRLRPLILIEQRLRRGVTERELPRYALSTLIDALVAGGKLRRKNIQNYQWTATSRETYDRSPTLQRVPAEVAKDRESLLKYLMLYRDRIAVENLRERGKLEPGAFYFSGAEEHYSLATLAQALYAGGAVSKEQYTKFAMGTAVAMEYFLQRREIVEPEIRRLLDGKPYMNRINRSLFTHLKNRRKRLAKQYVGVIFRRGRWFLNDPDVAVRSIYRADELAFMGLMSFRPQIEGILPAAADHLEGAGHRAEDEPAEARKDAVVALNDVVAEYNRRTEAGAIFDGMTYYAMRQINRLVQWNYDALPGGASAVVIGMHLPLPFSPVSAIS